MVYDKTMQQKQLLRSEYGTISDDLECPTSVLLQV